MTQSASKNIDCLSEGAVPGEIFPAEGEIILNADRSVFRLIVVNTGDRPIQVGSHYHFSETNSALQFDRKQAWGRRLNIPSGGAVRFEPGQEKEVPLILYGGKQCITGFSGQEKLLVTDNKIKGK